MSRGAGFVPWWRPASLARLVLDAVRHDRAFRWAAAGALLSLALLLGRGPATPSPEPTAGPPATRGDVPSASPIAIPPPAAPGPLGRPGPGGEPATAGPIAPSVPLGPSLVTPRDTFGTVPTPRGATAP